MSSITLLETVPERDARTRLLDMVRHVPFHIDRGMKEVTATPPAAAPGPVHAWGEEIAVRTSPHGSARGRQLVDREHESVDALRAVYNGMIDRRR